MTKRRETTRRWLSLRIWTTKLYLQLAGAYGKRRSCDPRARNLRNRVGLRIGARATSGMMRIDCPLGPRACRSDGVNFAEN